MTLFFSRYHRFATAFSIFGAVLFAAPSSLSAQTPAFEAVAEHVEAQEWLPALVTAIPLGKATTDWVIWSRLRAGEGSFADVSHFLQTRPDWPHSARLRQMAERKLTAAHAPKDVLDFFAESPPQTGEGAVAYARALILGGRPAEAKIALLAAWLTLSLDEAGETALLEAFGKVLQPYIWARVDAMLWRWRIADAERLLTYLPDERRHLFAARVAQIRGHADREARLEEVPQALRETAGLAYDIFNRKADEGDYSEAIEIAQARSVSGQALGQPFRWASWRGQLARWLMREGRPQEAYQLASRHFLTEGEQFADLEWLSGYVALRFLDAPEVAQMHFERVAQVSSAPISVARAGYWQGRAAEAMGQPAAPYYARAAQEQTAFYGLLAAEKLALPLDSALAGAEYFGDWRKGELLLNDLVKVLRSLLSVQDRGEAVIFVSRLAELLPRQSLGQLGDMLTAQNEPFLTLLLGKAAAARGIVLPAHYYPLHEMAQMDLPVEMAMALSIARRESEFNHGVGSPVGALGLMQLMPATAEEVAGKLGLPYSRGRLTSDWAYNARLGSTYLAELEARFGASPVLIAVGYNAGPGRVNQWLTARGDPRGGEVDVVDWIEAIPFTETRNYVMRVTESIPVYRARLGAQVDAQSFTALLQGARPLVRPRLRPEVVEE